MGGPGLSQGHSPGVGVADDHAAEVANERRVGNEELKKHEECERIPGKEADGVQQPEGGGWDARLKPGGQCNTPIARGASAQRGG